MSLITLDELARGATLLTFGSLAGLTASVWAPASAWWLLPAGCAALGGALTVPEVRQELQRALPAARPLLDAPRAVGHWLQTGELPAALWSLPGVTAPAALAERPARKRPAPAPDGALPLGEWLAAVNDRPDDNPHLTVTGPSGSGKTTFVSAALGRRPGRVVVLTPKVSPGAWRGAEVVTLDDDLSYAPLASAIDALQLEARRRAKALQRGEPLEPLTVVLDELPELVAEVPAAGPFAVRVSRWGRELGMRQVVLATSDDALNIKGWAATRPNYARVELGKPAEDGTRRGWLDDGQQRRPLDLGDVRDRADRAELRPWHEPATGTTQIARVAVAAEGARALVVSERVRPVAAPDDLLAALLAAPVSNASGRASHGAGVSVSVTGALDTDTDTGGVSRVDTVLDTPRDGGPTLRIDVHARAEAAGAQERQRHDPAGRRRGGLDARRRRQLAEQRRLEGRKAELQAAYAQRKAAGLSYRAAYAELGGASDDTRAWWRAAAGPR
jgi:hypothetical protein